MEDIGEFFGLLIIVFYALTISKYIFRMISRFFTTKLSKYEKLFIIYKKIMRIIMKGHSIFGILTILFIIIHFIIQFNSYGLNTTGLIAAIAMILQVIIGALLTIFKKGNKYLGIVHKIIAVIILISILIHI